jgi:hypothetical protein
MKLFGFIRHILGAVSFPQLTGQGLPPPVDPVIVSPQVIDLVEDRKRALAPLLPVTP